MSTQPTNGGRTVPPDQSSQVLSGSESRHEQHQWIVRSINELKDDNRKVTERVDQVFTHLSDTRNDSTLACAISRIEVSMSGVERQLTKLDGIDSKLGQHSVLLVNAEKQLGKLDGINIKLGDHSVLLAGLPEINKKLDRLANIETSVSRFKWFFGGIGAVLAGCAGVSWWLFGDYLAKILEALNNLVLK